MATMILVTETEQEKEVSPGVRTKSDDQYFFLTNQPTKDKSFGESKDSDWNPERTNDIER